MSTMRPMIAAPRSRTRLVPAAIGIVAAAMLVGIALVVASCGERAAGHWLIAFPGGHDGEWAIYAIEPNGGAPTRIAPAEAPFFWPPVPSPDGRKLVIPERDLVVMSAGGRQRRRLARGPYSTVAWSPDGQWIAFPGESSGLSVVGADGEHGRGLTRGFEDGEPAWSPDGKTIAFFRDEIGLMLVDSDGSHLRVLRRSGGYVQQLHWSSDGRSLSFVLDPAGNSGRELVTISAADGRTIRQIRLAHASTPLAWSPDGRRVAYVDDDKFRIVVMAADGSGRHALVAGGDPVWSPDGRSIVYVGDNGLRMMRPDGTGRRRLTRTYPNGVEPVWPVWFRRPVTPSPAVYRLTLSPRPDGAVLRTPLPVASLAAAGSRVALASPERVWTPTWISTPPLVLWDAKRGRTQRFALPGCQETESLVVLGDGTALDCPYGHAATFGRGIVVFSNRRPRPYELAGATVSEGQPPARLPGRLAAAADVLVFSTSLAGGSDRDAPREPQVFRLNGTAKERIIAGVDAGEPAAVDGGRIAIERDDGRVAVVTREGRVLGQVAPGGHPVGVRSYDLPPRTVGLSGRDLVVLRGGRLLRYDATSFRLVRTWRVDAKATLAGVADGLVAYVVGSDVHVLALRDGRSAVIRTASRAAVRAAMTSAGLFYAIHAKPILRYEQPPFRSNPATVTFLRRSAILRRLR